MKIENKIPFAINQSGEIVSVDEVPNGLGCGCTCPSCNGRLVARKGSKNVHHFGHHDKSQEECLYAFETSIRLMLLSKLDALNIISTPVYYIWLEHKHAQVTAGRPNITVCSIPQVSSHNSPAGLFHVVDKPDYSLALHFPAVNDTHSPIWLEPFIKQHPNTGVLSVQYTHFRKHFYDSQRPGNIDTTNWLMTILSRSNDCLNWLFHPHEMQVRQKLQEQLLVEQRERERKQAELQEQQRVKQLEFKHRKPEWQEQKRQRVKKLEFNRRKPEWLEQERQRNSRSPLSLRDPHCKERHSDARLSQFMAMYPNEEPKTRMCRNCGGNMRMGADGWSCGQCENKC